MTNPNFYHFIFLASIFPFLKEDVSTKACNDLCAHNQLPDLALKKSRIQETKHLSTDADSSTDTTVGWTKNTQKPNFFEKWKKSSKTQKRLEICQN